MKNKEEVVKEMQLVVEQMRLDDIEEIRIAKMNSLPAQHAETQNRLQALFITDKITDSATTVYFLQK